MLGLRRNVLESFLDTVTVLFVNFFIRLILQISLELANFGSFDHFSLFMIKGVHLAYFDTRICG